MASPPVASGTGPPSIPGRSAGPTGLPPLCRCWRRGPAAHSRAPQSCSSCQGPLARPPRPSGSTHCPASLASCCCRSSGTATGTELRQSPGPSPVVGLPQRSREAPPCASQPPTSCCSLSTALVTPSWPGWWYRLVMVSLRFSLSSAFSWGEGGTAAALVEDSEVGQGGSGRRRGGGACRRTLGRAGVREWALDAGSDGWL